MLRYILQACRNKLRTDFGDAIAEEFIAITPPGGKPAPFAGQWFCSVWSSSENNNDDRPEGLDETFSIKVTLTFRMAWAPQDRRGDQMVEQDVAVYEYAERAKDCLHGSDYLRQAANDLLGPDKNGMVETLVYTGTVYQDRDPSWVWSKNEDPDAEENNVYTAELSFTNGRRIQKYDEVPR